MIIPLDFAKTLNAPQDGPDEVLYEDSVIIVERKKNQIIQTGKPLRRVFMYVPQEEPPAQ